MYRFAMDAIYPFVLLKGRWHWKKKVEKKKVHDTVRKFAFEKVDILSQKNYNKKKNGGGDQRLINSSS